MKNFMEMIKKRIKLKTLIILIILLMFNAYAWFVYTTKVSGEMVAHVEAWDVIFQADDEEKISYAEFDVGRIYPRNDPSS